MQRWNNDDASLRGWMHEGMVAAMAEKLGLSAVDLQSRLDKGDTMYDVAITEGLTVEEFQTMIMDARTSAIEQALADGRITQKQADWMKARDDIRGFGKGGGFPHGFPWSKNDPSLVTTPTPGS